MFNIFNRNPKTNTLEWLEVDMHSHILPGIDDGCKTAEDSSGLLSRLSALGLSTFYFTPHIYQDMYPNTHSSVSGAYTNLQQRYASDGLAGYAAEYMVDGHFERRLEREEETLLTLPGKHVLIEMSYIQESKNIEKVIFDLQIKGYRPILAHPERYVFYHENPKAIERYKDLGCLLQLNVLSVFGYYGSREKKVAKYLLDRGLIDFVGTDAHHERHVYMLERGLKKESIKSYFKKCSLKNQTLIHCTT
ncbi:tyrosine-protein phosphatase [Sphingobacterium deserti]|uniref:protein-tyrosine-phosphatase n=1 Tax=Sphingobacterium deserti TaxID=1229276 RepID=A0A0B8T137_9SPHI|nr:CpsB/CapC family capsule biosynthesis tyrosine phosphatase [Sphingobacterium deserti]KGE14301.1 capsular polysaccharide biosynthesis protein [Sphingobacterium deserti]